MGSLDGRLVAVTRAPEQAGELTAKLEDRGAVPLAAPAIHILPPDPADLDPAIDELAAGAFAWLVLTSRNGVGALLGRMRDRGDDPAALATPVAAVGAGTAEELARWGVPAALVPAMFTTEALGEAMPSGRGKILLARADIATAELEDLLRRKGWSPVRVDAYRTALAPSLPQRARRAFEEDRVDAVTFTSASTVRGFLRAAGSLAGTIAAGRARVVSIGPVTTEEAERAGLRVAASARPHTIDGLVAALERALGPIDEGI